MDKREIKIRALRAVVELAEASIGAGYEPTGNEKDDELVFAEMRAVCNGLARRADVLASRIPRRER